MSSEKEIEEAREELKEIKRENIENIRVLNESVLLSSQAAEQSAQQIELLKSDILKFQFVAKTAHSNYDRELQLHAKAERDLKDRENGTFPCVLTNFCTQFSYFLLCFFFEYDQLVFGNITNENKFTSYLFRYYLIYSFYLFSDLFYNLFMLISSYRTQFYDLNATFQLFL